MLRFGEFIAKHRVLILAVGILLMIPSAFGYINTRVNYDILSYLPKDINTMVGQDILIDEFGQGGFSFVMVDGMTEREIADTADKISQVDGVSNVVCYETLTDLNVPKEILPSKVRDFFNKDDTTLMAVFFEESTSADRTLNAIDEMREITSEQCFISGMSAVTADMKHLSDSESLIYAAIEHRHRDSMEPRHKLRNGRDILHNSGAGAGAPARRNYGLLHIPLAQLQGTAEILPREQDRGYGARDSRYGDFRSQQFVHYRRRLPCDVLHELHART